MWDKLAHKWFRVPYALHVRTNQYVKKPRATILLIHGIGNSGAAWDNVISQLPNDCHIVTIDLLGFGKSPRPPWAVYDAKTQARSVIATIIKLRLSRRLIIIGHSLGALVAVEVAKRYPLLVRSLILCSPPFYDDSEARRLVPNSTKILKDLYRLAYKHPEEFIKISIVATKLRLVNEAFSLTHDDVDSYMSALEASIINQTSLDDAMKLKTPMHIIHGRLDPVVIAKNLRYLVKANKHARLTSILATHEVKGSIYIRTVVEATEQAITKRVAK